MKRAVLAASSTLLMVGLVWAACAPAAPVPTPTPRPAVAQPTPVLGLTPTPAPPALAPTPLVKPTPVPLQPTPTPAAVREKPRYGGILTISHQDDIPHFDMHQDTTNYIQRPLQSAYSLLVQTDPLDPTKIIPDLAERWEVSPDGKVYTFYLNKGAKFHDGKPATSADVKASFERQISPPKGIVSPRQGLYQSVDKLEAPDDYTVRFTLKYPQAAFLSIVTIPMNWIFPKHILDKKGDMRKDILGTGPFKLKEYVRGVAYEVVKNPDYFMPGRPYLDGIKSYIIKDYASILAAFRTKQVLMTGIYGTDVPYQQIVRKELPQAIIQKSAGMPNPYSFVPNVGRSPWKDERVRRAVYLAIDRQAGIQVLEQGEGALGSYLAAGPWGIPEGELLKMPGFRQPKDADIAEAKKLLAEAGYPQGFKTEIMTRTTKGFVDLAIFLKGEVAKIGIDATVKVVEVGVEKTRMFSKDFDVVAFRDGIPIDEPDVVFAEIYLSTSGKNWGGYKDPKIDELYLKQSQALDPAERRRLLRQMDALLVQGVPRVNVMYGVKARFLWPEVRDFKMFGVYHNNHFRDVWLAQ